MNIIGIIAEYNPFHLGHLYQIDKIKELYPDSIIITIVSSSFTERGDVSIINKWDRTKILLDNKLDLIIELPFVYATQSADLFAKGALYILNKLQIDTLVFGTESDDIELLKKLANIQLANKKYDQLVKRYLDKGLNYPTSMSKALEDLTDKRIELPNDLLGLSYVKEIIKNNYKINPISIKRTTDYHGENINSKIVNASLIRKLLLNNKKVNKFLPKDVHKYLYKININDYFPYLKYNVLTNIDNLNIYQTVDEGIENRIKKCINNSNSWEELVTKIKTKRYTYNKINRMLVHILTSFTKEEASNLDNHYIRLLGFSERGKNYLNKIKKDIDIPLVTNYKKKISNILDIELRITSIYDLIANDKLIEKEYKNKPIIK